MASTDKAKKFLAATVKALGKYGTDFPTLRKAQDDENGDWQPDAVFTVRALDVLKRELYPSQWSDLAGDNQFAADSHSVLFLAGDTDLREGDIFLNDGFLERVTFTKLFQATNIGVLRYAFYLRLRRAKADDLAVWGLA